SLWIIWPFQHRLEVMVADKPRIVRSSPYLPDLLQAEVLIAGACAVSGLVLVLVLQRLANHGGSSGTA
ncbi:MAG TPA: hypothetical protein VIT83_01875, partial [Gammaproteobacteria bacterium]